MQFDRPEILTIDAKDIRPGDEIEEGLVVYFRALLFSNDPSKVPSSVTHVTVRAAVPKPMNFRLAIPIRGTKVNTTVVRSYRPDERVTVVRSMRQTMSFNEHGELEVFG